MIKAHHASGELSHGCGAGILHKPWLLGVLKADSEWFTEQRNMGFPERGGYPKMNGYHGQSKNGGVTNQKHDFTDILQRKRRSISISISMFISMSISIYLSI